jgi:hypothetical protein
MNPITLLCAGAAPDADPAGALRLPAASALRAASSACREGASIPGFRVGSHRGALWRGCAACTRARTTGAASTSRASSCDSTETRKVISVSGV